MRGRNTEPSFQAVWEGMRADYDAAKTSRFRRTPTGYAPMGSGADYHYRSDAEHLRLLEWARHYDRNDPIVGQAITRLIDNIYQSGFVLDPQTGDAEADAYIKTKFRAWADDPDACDAAGEQTFHDIAKLRRRSMIVDGDVFHALLSDGTVQSIEAHRCRTPSNTKRNVVYGVHLDKMRKRLAYWFTKDDIQPHQRLQRVSDTVPYPARDADGYRYVLHGYDPKRSSQTRGVCAYAQAFDYVGIHADTQFAVLVKAQVASCITVLEQLSTEAIKPKGIAEGAESTQTLSDGTSRTITELAPGVRITGTPGSTLSMFSPNVPNPEHFEHTMLILSIIAINLGLPVHVLLLDASRTNFSGWRGAIDQARMSWREMQRADAQHFYSPVFRWKVRQWIYSDPQMRYYADMLGETLLYKHTWHPPYWPYIQPTQDAQADQRIAREGLNSRRRLLSRRSLDITEVDDERIEDDLQLIKRAIIAADAINKQHPGAAVHWRDFISTMAGSGAAPSKGEV